MSLEVRRHLLILEKYTQMNPGVYTLHLMCSAETHMLFRSASSSKLDKFNTPSLEKNNIHGVVDKRMSSNLTGFMRVAESETLTFNHCLHVGTTFIVEYSVMRVNYETTHRITAPFLRPQYAKRISISIQAIRTISTQSRPYVIRVTKFPHILQ